MSSTNGRLGSLQKGASKARVASQFFRKWVESRVGETLNRPDICRPSMVCTILTSECNYKCSFCNHPQMTQVDRMSLEKWKEILGSLKDWLGWYRINFLGGEPFMYPELFPLLEFCRDNGITAGITTNGWFLTEKNCKRLGEMDLFNISLSVDGFKPEIHDELRGIPGAHKRLFEGIENLKRYTIPNSNVRVAFRTNVLAHNLDDLVPLAHFVKVNGLHCIGYQPVEYRPMELEEEWEYVRGEKKDACSDSPNDRLTQFTVAPGDRPENMEQHWVGDFDKLDATLEEIKGLHAKGFPILNSRTHLDAIRDYYHNPSLIYEIERDCKTAWEQMVILPDGYVRSCTELPPYGNLMEQSPKEIWTSAAAAEHRQKVANCSRTCLNMFHWKRSFPEKVEMFTKFF